MPGSRAAPSSAPEVTVESDTEVAPDNTVRCAACGHDVTDRRLAIEVSGSHWHRCRNPAGWSFQIGCFSDAPGCSSDGSATDHATWFPGYAWCFAPCGSCGTHLGWWYLGRDTFVGLIVSRIR